MFALRSRSSATKRSFGEALRVVDDRAQLGQVRRPQVVRDVVHRLRGELGQHRRLDGQEPPAAGPVRPRRRPRRVTSRYSVRSSPVGSSGEYEKAAALLMSGKPRPAVRQRVSHRVCRAAGLQLLPANGR